ncbi:MAG: transglycosylase domain-containing protein [Firmicutes bacterium]|uniref:Penicillin-binding protein 2A n=1 Tax=Melghirimyces thermohalophilus TaxID=1236220 RepID=A0A1G6PWQ1_9BACL|nr:transglycosylase domain-containing protein [Melghirimyces thermohalophilus]MDA8354354.1 transglycosylase domain-containing protein [Bacillota bacterium]SDC83817.1 penicillin-binding protein 2A [Melghirimyces thermohalophilus]
MDNYRMSTGGMPPRSRSTGRRAGRRSLTNRAGKGGNGGGRRFRFFNKKWILLVLLTTLLLVVGGCSAVMMNAKKFSMDQIEDSMKTSSVVLDKDGDKVMNLGATNREYVQLDDVKSPELWKTYLAVEDERFFEHNGVDYRGLARAVVSNIVAMGKAEGASTITMQVARNAVLKEREKTYTRKLNEIAVALDLERKYDKMKILEVYLNYIDLGSSVQGIKMAAKVYFDKDITKEKLEPHEIALLAGLPKAPYGYNPYTNPEEAKERRNVVLNKMAEDTALPGGPIISKEEAEKYKKKPLGVNPDYVDKHLKSKSYYAYKDVLLDEIERRYSIDNIKEFANSGYTVHTTLDPNAQQAVEKALEKKEYFINQETGQPTENLNAAMTIMNTKGEIVAVGGGRDYKPGYYNWAKKKHQPGSTIKPITVFGPAVQDHGYNEFSTVEDKPIKIGNYTPKNEQGEFFGEVSLQEVVNKSLNASTILMLKDVVKLDPAAQYAEKAGLELHQNDRGSYAALGLGGMTKGASTIEMAQAYSSFANVNTGGYTPAHTVKKIVDPTTGQELQPEQPIPQTPKQVWSKKTAWYMTRMLLNNVEEGTGTNAQIPGYDVAGKTGTTQNNKKSWFIGYTPNYVGAVTVFNMYDKDDSNDVKLSGGGYAAPIFRDVMTQVLEGQTPQPFKKPAGVPEPQPPFELKPIQDLKGQYDPSAKAVNLQWSDYDDRLKYKVQRSEDGQDWKDIGETKEGSFSDSSIKPPKPNEDGGGWFGIGDEPAEPKTYQYRVIAVDTQAEEGEPKESDPSNVLTVEVTPDQQSEEPPEDQNPQDQQQDQQQDQFPDRGDSPFPDGGDEEGRQPDGGDPQGDQQPDGGDQEGGDDGGGIFG